MSKLHYIPLDELLARPRYRILRRLLRADWLSAFDLFDSLDVPDYDGALTPERRTYSATLTHLVRAGMVEADHGRLPGVYRITETGRVAARDPEADAIRQAERKPIPRERVRIDAGARIGETEVVRSLGQRERKTTKGVLRETWWLVRCLGCDGTRELRADHVTKGRPCRQCSTARAAAKRTVEDRQQMERPR